MAPEAQARNGSAAAMSCNKEQAGQVPVARQGVGTKTHDHLVATVFLVT